MTSAEKKALRTCTKQGLIDLINDPRFIQNKANQFPTVIGYLARHGMSGGASKEDFMDLVYTARNELLAQAGQSHIDSKVPFAYDNVGNLKGAADTRVKEFIRDPVGAMKREMETLANRKENYAQMNDPDEVQFYIDLKTNANIHAIELGITGEQDKNKYQDKPEMVDILSRIQKKNPGDATIDASLKRINSGFFGTLFRRKSKEYSAFEESLKTFRDAKMAMSGNVEDLKKKTTAYLEHTIPNFKYSKDMPREQWLAALPKGKRDRAEFCLDVLDSIEENKKLKPYMDNVDKAVNGRPIDKSLDQHNVIDNELKQADFQEELKNNIEPPAPKKEEVVVEEKQPAIEQNDLEP